MKNQSILITSVGVVELTECDIPEINENQVLVKIIRSSVSAGTERANLLGDPNVSILTGPSVIFPRKSGYSSSGIVVKVGNNVTTLKVGDRVACSWSLHQTYCAINESCAYKLPDNVGYDAAALVHIATFPLAAIRKCRFEVGQSALVMGVGVLGILGIKLLYASGAHPIIAADPVAEKRELALSLGADYALDPTDPHFAKAVKDITGIGVDIVLEITGKGVGLDTALDCVRPRGSVALLGCTRSSDFSIDYYRKVHGPGVTLVGAHTAARPKQESSEGWWTERDDAKAIIGLLSGGRLDFSSLVEEVYPIEGYKEVYSRLATSNAFPIVQFDWSHME